MKKLLAVLLATSMMLSLAACGAKEEVPAVSSAPASSTAPEEGSVWYTKPTEDSGGKALNGLGADNVTEPYQTQNAA